MKILRLVDMGFSREEAGNALQLAAGDVAAAANILLGV
jgi:NACalpha-BTF3-like transcription factor